MVYGISEIGFLWILQLGLRLGFLITQIQNPAVRTLRSYLTFINSHIYCVIEG